MQEESQLSAADRQRRREAFERYVAPFMVEHFENDRSYRYGPPRLKLGGYLGGEIRVLAEFDVDAVPAAPREYEVRAWFEPVVAGIEISNVYQVPRHTFNAWFQTHDEFPRPELLIDWIEIEGPMYDAWPPTSHQHLTSVSLAMNGIPPGTRRTARVTSWRHLCLAHGGVL